MNGYVLVADDRETLIDYLSAWAHSQGLSKIVFADSFAKAMQILKEKAFSVAIVDWKFESEGQSGLEILKLAKSRNPEIAAYLLTGYRPDDDCMRQLGQIGAKLLSKYFLHWSVMAPLLKGETPPSQIRGSGLQGSNAVTPDALEMNLRLDESRSRIEELDQILNVATAGIVRDIKLGLDRVTNPEMKRLAINGECWSADDLKQHLERRTPVAMELIKIHDWILSNVLG